MKKIAKKFVLLLSLSVVFCLLSTSCLTFLATVGGIIFNFSDSLSENRIIVYGSDNPLAVTFRDGKMLAEWDVSSSDEYELTVDRNGDKQEFLSENGYVDLTEKGYAYGDTLTLSLAKTSGTAAVTYAYAPLTASEYSEFSSPVDAGFSEIDRYIATRAEWFDFFSYLVIFREGAKEQKDDNGDDVYLLETTCYIAYDFTGFKEYADLSRNECLENEVYSAIDAYEDSASYAYSYELASDGKTATLYLKFYYPNVPSFETNTADKYRNDTKATDRAHYSDPNDKYAVRYDRTFPIDSVEKTIPVESSDQLYFALKKGYRPLPVSGSAADLLYTKMRTILSYINSDSDTAYNKLHYIYDYIIDTVLYDYVFTDEVLEHRGDSYDVFLYKCLYLEGVFGMQQNGTFADVKGNDKRVAICDGLSKAYMCMAVIEGIPCLKVSGTVNNEGHAWNKAKIGGNWYMIDTTWGNKLSKNYVEYLSHSYFLTKDDSKHVENPYLNYPAAPYTYKETVAGPFSYGSHA